MANLSYVVAASLGKSAKPAGTRAKSMSGKKVRLGRGGTGGYRHTSLPEMKGSYKGSLLGGKGLGQRLSMMGSMMGAGIRDTAASQGRSVLGLAGSHAVRGAVWGGIGNGAINAAQGGSFWEGAKEGAFKGAAGWTGLRMAQHGMGRRNVIAGGANMWGATGTNIKVAPAARAMLGNAQRADLAKNLNGLR